MSAAGPYAQPTTRPNPQPYTQPTDEELAAILAAVELCWPKPVVLASAGAGAPPGPSPLTWRFSGRWWSRPVTARRERP